MRKFISIMLFCGLSVFIMISATSVGAISPNVVISQIQLGDPTSASNEFVELYNNSDYEVEITNWCLYYASASSGQIGSKMNCFLTENNGLHLFLPAHSYAYAVSNQLAASLPSLGYDMKFSATLSGTGGHVRLIDENGLEVDKIGWGASAVSAEGNMPVATASIGKILSRKMLSIGFEKDTDKNVDDFEEIAPRPLYSYGLIIEVQDLCMNIDGLQASVPDGYSLDVLVGSCLLPPVDICSNLDGIQTVMPSDYLLDQNGDCRQDVCLNIDGLQLITPVGMDRSEVGDCSEHDRCLNIEGIQAVIPQKYKQIYGSECRLDLPPIKISELLPNAIGSDDGNEYIEILNPTVSVVDLADYVLFVGSKRYYFPVGSTIKAGEYALFYNSDIHFTLVNTTSSVRIESSDGSLVSQSPIYSEADEGMSWAEIDGAWQYTDRPTPGGANLGSKSVVYLDPTDETKKTELKPCGPNQYRSPDTNRCRNIVTASVLAPCKDGQYRSEVTGRCRSIANDVSGLVPCAEGEERNPATNRCRKIASVLGDSDLKPCPEGQERNPETNRCRKVLSSTIPKADYQPIINASGISSNFPLWSISAVAAVAIGYGCWEWREDLVRLSRRARAFVGSKK